MSACDSLHEWANSLPAFRFPFDNNGIPLNGIYILFEKGEFAHGAKRIVRAGTHTGENQLRSRLRQHFLIENKDRSIFRGAPRDPRAGPTARARAELEHHHAPGQERPADWPGHGKNPAFRRRARLRPRLPPWHGARGSEPIQYSRSASFLRWCGSVTRARARSIPSRLQV